MEMILHTAMSPCDADTMTMKTVVTGHDPLILIEYNEDSTEDCLVLDVDATGFEDYNEIADMLEAIAHGLRNGEES